MSDIIATNNAIRDSVSCDSGESNVKQYLKLSLQLAYVLPLGFLYLSFLMLIVKKRKVPGVFEDSFFTLHLVDGVITLYFLVLNTSFFRVTSYVRPVCEFLVPLLKDPSYILTPFYTSYMYAQLAKMLSTLAMSINRYTSVNNPVQHKMIWMKYSSKAIALIFIIPLFGVWPVAIGNTSFLPFNGNGYIAYEHVFSWARTSYGRLALSIPTIAFIIYSSIITSTKLRKLGGHMKKVEFSMNVATIFTSCGFVSVVVLQFLYLKIDTNTVSNEVGMTKLIMAATQLSNDFYMLSGPAVLVILEKRMRSSFRCCTQTVSSSGRRTNGSVQPITFVISH